MTDASAVAIIGMSGRFPGARDIGEYWQNLREGVCAISDFSAEELSEAGVDQAESGRLEYVPSKGYLADADRFEPELFGFTPAEAAALDPQHRLLLETAWAALEDAGYNPRDAPSRTGVYAGGSLTEHMIAAHADRVLTADLGDMQVRTLTDREFVSSWLSYRLNLTGPSLTVQTGCSTSLMATHLAVQGLLLGECDTALAGGVCVDSVRKRGYLYQEGGIFSPDGRCRPFDEKAAGTVGGNGVGIVVLRRLADAIADGDPIRAVIRGTAVTNDGSAKVGFTAPSVGRQTDAIAEAWSVAGLEPAAAQYLEMHGTATSLGDRIEVAAMRAALDTASGRCGIGSVKSSIGHLDAAAGVAGLIKVVLMLEHRTLVPTVNVTHPHPDLDLDTGPLSVVTDVDEWKQPQDGPRLAGVTSIGIGGSNVHVVLAEAPTAPVPPPASEPELLPVSARTLAQLATSARRLAAHLRQSRPVSLADVGYTLRAGRAPLPVRGYVVAGTAAAAADALESLARGGSPDGASGASGELGERWLRAEQHVTWPTPPRGARRVHLPTYPFAGDVYGAYSLTRPAGPPPAEVPAQVSGARITEMLSASLGLTDPADLDRTYFGAGGDSLAAIHLLGRVRDDFGIDVPVELLFEEIPLSELAARITEMANADGGGMILESILEEIEKTE